MLETTVDHGHLKMDVYTICDEDTYEELDNLDHNTYVAMVSADVIYQNASTNGKVDVTKEQRKRFYNCNILTRKKKIMLCGVITLIPVLLCFAYLIYINHTDRRQEYSALSNSNYYR